MFVHGTLLKYMAECEVIGVMLIEDDNIYKYAIVYVWRVYFFDGCLRAMHRAICWQKVSGVVAGKMSVSSSLEHTALKYGSLPPTSSFNLSR